MNTPSLIVVDLVKYFVDAVNIQKRRDWRGKNEPIYILRIRLVSTALPEGPQD